MVNKQYVNGRAREYRVMDKLRKKGFVVARTSGSHGIFDLIAIDQKELHIYFLQLKPRSMSENARKKLELTGDFLNNEYWCKFKVISLEKELNKEVFEK